MLFNKKHKVIETFMKRQRDIALEFIDEALADCTTKGDYSYIIGLLDISYELGAITMNERAEINNAAAKAAKLIKE